MKFQEIQMIEILNLIFSDWKIFCCVIIFLSAIGSLVEWIITAIEDRK